MTQPDVIKIRNWPKFQHYKRRNPPWIRLYRDVIDSDEWRGLSDTAGRLLPELWLLASEAHPGGSFSADLEGIAWQTGRPVGTCEDLIPPLLELEAASFITLPASILASVDASSAVFQRQRTEGEQSTTSDQNGVEKQPIDVPEWRLFEEDFSLDPMSEEEIAEL